MSAADAYQQLTILANFYNLITHYQSATVSHVKGSAIGGGVRLAFACDTIIITEDTCFHCPEYQFNIKPF